jgi:uncharacterized protein DUF1844
MHSRKNEEPEEFKVVDRRLFTSEGELRKDLPPEEEPAPAAKSSPGAAPSQQKAPAPKPTAASSSAGASTAASAPAGRPATAPASMPATSTPVSGAPDTPDIGPVQETFRPGPAGEPASEVAVQFQHLIMSLVSSAMYQLGMAARPGEMPPPPDLPAAHETIDILGVLAQKTKGNLTPEEDELLVGSLQELRIAYVELSRRAGRIR